MKFGYTIAYVRDVGETVEFWERGGRSVSLSRRVRQNLPFVISPLWNVMAHRRSWSATEQASSNLTRLGRSTARWVSPKR